MIGNKSHMIDTRYRSVVKGILWRLLATLTTIVLVYIFTRDLTISTEIGGVEVVVKLLLYYGHERVWNLIRWGKTSLETEQTRTSK